jgi:toxin ParE1/3/4
MHVEWSDFAREDLDSLVAYISRDSMFYAKTFAEKIVLATRRLKQFPQSGRMIPESDDKTLREIIVQGYRVMYRLEEERVLILTVMHGRRDLSNPDNQPWETH